jgi:hypothetical protein
MSQQKIRAGKNGCSEIVVFFGKNIYHNWNHSSTTTEILGNRIDKEQWILNNIAMDCITDGTKINDIKNLLIDWILYENGWYVPTWQNNHLWRYLCQLGRNSRPKALEYLNNKE